jgi:hypothetical protein
MTSNSGNDAQTAQPLTFKGSPPVAPRWTNPTKTVAIPNAPRSGKERQTRFWSTWQCQAEIEFACPSSRQLRPRLPQTRNMADCPLGKSVGRTASRSGGGTRAGILAASYCWRRVTLSHSGPSALGVRSPDSPPFPHPHNPRAPLFQVKVTLDLALTLGGPRSHGLRFRPDCTPPWTRDGGVFGSASTVEGWARPCWIRHGPRKPAAAETETWEER